MPTKKPARKATKPTARTPATGRATGGADVTVRMFCQGLGDCFLITIPQDGARPYSILIDFGLALGTPDSKVLMNQVAKKIVDLTDGIIDLVVLTHEHWDHVSGYSLIANELQDMKKTGKLTFKHLWVAWTEKKDDPLAETLRKEFKKATVALTGAATRLQRDETSRARLKSLDGVLAFYGLGAKASSGTVADAMKLPHTLVGNAAAVDYLKPGECLTLPGATGNAADFQALVLGPPYDRVKLRKLNPSTKGDEAYEKKKGEPPGVAFNWSWMVSALNDGTALAGLADGETPIDVESSFPFDKNLRIPLEGAKNAANNDPRFASYYSAEEKDVVRRIDHDWLWTGAQRLGLWMDNYTNNTCLVLAFELPKSKQILLFPADAQAGSWRSWHDQTYKTKDGRTLACTDLLAKTALYKVGHHGSHNATLRKQGLELMTHPDLVAMLPVEADGVTRLGYGQMPLKSLMKALNEKTDKRVLRIDDTWTSDQAPGTWKKQGLSASLSPERITVIAKGKPVKRALYMQLSMRDG